MKIIKYSIFVCLIAICSCKQDPYKNLKSNKWISASFPGEKTAGLYLDFGNDDTLLFINSATSEIITKTAYYFDSDNNLFIFDSVRLGKPNLQDADKLIFKGVKPSFSYIAVKDYNLNIDTAEFSNLLLNNIWEMNRTDRISRLEFLNAQRKPFSQNNKAFKIFYEIKETGGWEYFNTEKWTIKQIDSSIILFMSNMNKEFQAFQIKKITDSTIIAETLLKDSIVEFNINKLKNLNQATYNEKKNSIIGNWELTDFAYPVDSSSIDTTYNSKGSISSIEIPARRREYKPTPTMKEIREEMFASKQISYSFTSNGNCCMKCINDTLRDANWNLTNDGKYIQTVNGLLPSMRIISLEESKMTIERFELIKSKDSEKWRRYYIRETLQKAE